MANVDGAWTVTVNTPMGPQKSTLTVRSDGSTFAGTFKGGMGTLPVEDGKVDGDTLNWAMKMTAPFPLAMTCTATISGDTIEGTASGGSFGTFPMKGQRA